MIERVTVTRVAHKEIEINGQPKKKIGIQTDVHGDKWLGAFESFGTKKIEQGWTGDIVAYQSGDFWNFRVAGATDYLRRDVDMIKKHLGLDLGSKLAGTGPIAEPVKDEFDNIPF